MQKITQISESLDHAGHALSEPAPLLALPSQPELGVRVRDARPDDLAFIDAPQKKHSKAVGWMPTGQLKGHIAKGHVVVAEVTQGFELRPNDRRDAYPTARHCPRKCPNT